MLEKLLMAGLVLPFMARPKPQSAPPIDRLGAIDLPPIPPEPEPVALVTPDQAVREFAANMIEYTAGDAVRIHWVHWSYRKLAEDHGWPQLSVKALSQRLVALGCRREQIDLRASEGRRITFITFPERLVEPRRLYVNRKIKVKKRSKSKTPGV